MAFRAARVTLRTFRPVAAAPLRRVVAKAADAVAAPYAQGIIELASEQGILEAVYNDFMGIQSLIAAPENNDKEVGEGEELPDLEQNDVRSFFMGVPINAEERKTVIDTIASEMNLQTETVNFLKLLIDVNRLETIEDIIKVFEEKYNKMTETEIVTLRSATRLEQEQEFEIAKTLQEETGSKNIKIKPVIDDELVGGFILEYGDNVIDLSLSGLVDDIEGDLMASPVGV